MDLMSPKNCVFSLVLQEERHRTIDPLNAPSSRNAVDMLMKFEFQQPSLSITWI
jgi:hypothetical protein